MQHALPDLRTQIDAIDTQIATLLDKRMDLTDKVGTLKKEQNIDPTDTSREEEVTKNLRSFIQHPLLRDIIGPWYESFIHEVKKGWKLQYAGKQVPFRKIGMLGMGMMGGSLVKALKIADPSLEISTIRRDSISNRLADKQGYLTHRFETLQKLTHHVEVLVLATPIGQVEKMAQQIQQASPQNLLVIDIASVKSSIGKNFEDLSQNGIEFLPTHPMAGSDKKGFANARPTLFVDNPWLICPHSKSSPKAIEYVTQLVSALGAHPMQVPYEEHDALIASSSHLVRLISMYLFAFMHDERNASMQVSGTGFEKMTALTSSNALMNTQIFDANLAHVQDEVQAFQEYIQKNSLTRETMQEFFTTRKQQRADFIEAKYR